MLTILLLVLGLVIIASAIAADRSKRAQRPLLAIVLNLCGIACLLCGLLTVFAWSHGGGRITIQRVASATPGAWPSTALDTFHHHRTKVVRLRIGPDGRLESPQHHLQSVSHGGTMVVALNVPAEADDAGPATASDDHGSEPRSAETVTQSQEATAAEMEDVSGEPQASSESLAEMESQLPAQTVPVTELQIDFDARPPWVERPATNVGGVHQISVTGGPYSELRVARKELYEKLKAVTDEYINDVLGNEQAARWIQFDPQEIRRNLVASGNFFDEKFVSPSVGVMYQSHALLEFGPPFHDRIEQSWHEVMARTQLVRVALIGAGVLGVLVLLFGYLNADTATRGFYSRRLKFVTALAILGLIVAGILFARSIPWLWL